MQRIGSKLITGSIFRSVTFAAMLIIMFFLTPFIIKSIGDKMFGLWSLVGSFMGLTGFLDLGLGTALKRFLPKYYATENYAEVNRVFCSSLALFLLIGILAFVSIILSLTPLHSWLGKQIPFRIFCIVFVVLAGDLALQFPMRTFLGYFEAHLRYDFISAVEFIKIVIKSSLIYFFLSKQYGIISMVSITFFVNIFGYILLIIAYIVKYKDIQFKNSNINIGTMKSLFNYSYKNMLAAVGDALRYQIDNFIIVTFAGLSSVTPYAIGSRIAQYLIDGVSTLMGQTVPIFSGIEAEKDFTRLKQTYFLLMKISTILSVYMGGVIIIFGKQFITRWLGSGFEVTYTVMTILAVGLSISLTQYATVNLLQGVSKHSIIMFCNLGEGICNVVLSMILIKFYGIVGVAFGTTIPMLLSMIIVVPFLTTRNISYINLYEYYFQALGPIFLKTALLMIGIYFAIRGFLQPDYFRLLLLAFCTLIYFPTIYIFGFSKTEKRDYLEWRLHFLFQKIISFQASKPLGK